MPTQPGSRRIDFSCARIYVNEPFRKLEEVKIPVVFLDKVPEADQYNKVCMDDEGAALGELATSRLLDYMNGKTFTRSLVVPVRLVEGKSVERVELLNC